MLSVMPFFALSSARSDHARDGLGRLTDGLPAVGMAKAGGEGGIRILGTLASTHDFQRLRFDTLQHLLRIMIWSGFDGVGGTASLGFDGADRNGFVEWETPHPHRLRRLNTTLTTRGTNPNGITCARSTRVVCRLARHATLRVRPHSFLSRNLWPSLNRVT
jgi:hypothetical protein